MISPNNAAYFQGPSGESGPSLLEQALTLCASSCLDKCGGTSAGGPDAVWMRLYAASERLKLAVREGDAAQAILDIGSNLMACEEMGILCVNDNSGLTFMASCGITTEHEQRLAAHENEVRSLIQADQIVVAGQEESGSTLCSELGITAVVPIWHNRRARGAIIFYSFLAQRNGVDPADRELLELLSIFSGPSLFSGDPGKESAHDA